MIILSALQLITKCILSTTHKEEKKKAKEKKGSWKEEKSFRREYNKFEEDVFVILCDNSDIEFATYTSTRLRVALKKKKKRIIKYICIKNII